MAHIHGGNIYHYDTILDFSANINFRGMPDSVRRAAMEAIDQSVHYPDPEYRLVREAIARREGVKKEQILCGNGAAELMFSYAFAQRPQTAVLAAPGFYEYEQALRAAGADITFVTLPADEGFVLTESVLEQIPVCDTIILGNPNNPTGRTIHTELLEKLLHQCEENKSRVILDESFFDFLTRKEQGRTLEGTRFLQKYTGLCVLKSFTKMYAMPGLRFGYFMTADQKLMDKMRANLQPWNVSLPAGMAAVCASAETAFARKSAKATAENRAWLEQQLNQAGYPFVSSATNYILFRGPAGLCDYGIQHGILIRDCSNFRGLGEGYYRVCVRSQKENEALMKMLKSAAEDLAMTNLKCGSCSNEEEA